MADTTFNLDYVIKSDRTNAEIFPLVRSSLREAGLLDYIFTDFTLTDEQHIADGQYFERGDEANWLYDDDMKKISAAIPDVLFIIHCVGTVPDANSKGYFYNGKSEWVDAEITFPNPTILGDAESGIGSEDPHLLIETTGYEINTIRFESYDAAFKQMQESYNKCMPDQLYDECKEFTYLNENEAALYDNGNNIFLWKIEPIKVN